MALGLATGLCLVAEPAQADLYATEKGGVLHITTYKLKKGKLVHHIKEDRRRAAGQPKRRSKRSGRRPAKRSLAPVAYAPVVRQAAQHYQLPEALIWAVMKIESGFNPEAVSRVGAQGLMQLMPRTAKEMGVEDSFDPTDNILGGTRFLRILANKFDGDLVLTLSAYHAGGAAVAGGAGPVDEAPQIPYEQTAKYVRMVLNAYYAYQRDPPVPPAR